MHGKIINEREHYALLSTGGAASFFTFFMEDLGIPILEKLWRQDESSVPWSCWRSAPSATNAARIAGGDEQDGNAH